MPKKNLVFLVIVILVIGIISGLSIGMGITTKVLRPVPKPPKQTRNSRQEPPRETLNESRRVRVTMPGRYRWRQEFYCQDYEGELSSVTPKDCYKAGGEWCMDVAFYFDTCYNTAEDFKKTPWGWTYDQLRGGGSGDCPQGYVVDISTGMCMPSPIELY